MNTTKRFRQRAVVLAVAMLGLALAAVPLLGTAQDATPQASPVAEAELLAQGEQIYTSVCIACHQPDGKGIAGIYLPLNGNPLITLDDPTYVIDTVLNGRGGMPRFNGTYDDTEIAAVISYIRQEWENDAGPVSPEQVADVRAQTAEELAGPTPTPEGQLPSGDAQGAAGESASPEATPGS